MTNLSINQFDAWQQATGADGAKRIATLSMVAGVPISLVPVPTPRHVARWPSHGCYTVNDPAMMQQLATYGALIGNDFDGLNGARFQIGRVLNGAAAVTRLTDRGLHNAPNASLGFQVEPVSYADFTNGWQGITAQQEADLMARAFERFTLSGETGYDHNAGELLKQWCNINAHVDAATINNILQLARASMAYDSKSAIGERINRWALAESLSYFLTLER